MYDSKGWVAKLSGRVGSYANQDVRYLLQSGFWLNMGTILNLAFSFGLSIVFANFLPKEVYGTYQYLLSILSLLASFTLSGVNSAIIRSVARGYDGSLRASIRPQLMWSLPATALAMLAAAYYALQGNLGLALGLLGMGLAVPIITTFNSYSAFLIGKKAFRAQFFYSTLSNLAYYVCIILAAIYMPTALPLFIVNIAISALCAYIAYRHTVKTFKPEGSSEPDLLAYGGHLSFLNLLGTVAGQLDNLLVFHFLGPVELAVYSIATLIPEKLSGLLKNMTTSVITRFAEQSLDEIRGSLTRIALIFGAAILAGTAIYALVLPYFFAFFYPRYLDSVPYSQVFALTLVVAVGNLIGTVLLAHQRIKGLYVLNTAMPILQIVLQVVGILAGGLWGLVIARVIASGIFIAFSSVITFAVFRRSEAR